MTNTVESLPAELAEFTRGLHIPRHRAPYDAHARMSDKIAANATPVVPRHAAEVPA